MLVLAGATRVPDPLFVMIADLGQRYRVIAPAYPAATRINELVDGVVAVLDADHVTTAHVVGSSFGGYVAQCLVRADPDRVDKLVLAQTGVRHFAGPGAITVLRWSLEVAPTRALKAFMWRTWQALLLDLGDDKPFWTALLRDILDQQLTKPRLLAVMAAMRASLPTAGRIRGRCPTDCPCWCWPPSTTGPSHDRQPRYARSTRTRRSTPWSVLATVPCSHTPMSTSHRSGAS